MVGPNFALVGDAAGFIDPIFSTGVFLAMKSATAACAAIEARLENGTMKPLLQYQKRVGHSLDHYLEFISNFYLHEFLEVFLQPAFMARLLGIPALEQLRKESCERIRAQQIAGDVRDDIDAQQIANGLVAIVLSLLMSLLQTGADPATLLGPDVAAVVEAALSPPRN